MSTETPHLSRQDASRGLAQLARREVQLWSMLFLVLVVTAAAFLSMVVPNVTWKSEPMRLESHYLPQLLFGFIALIVLFNLYVFEQKRKLDRLRDQLTIRLVSPDSDDTGIAADPETKLFSREFANEILVKEAIRAKRAGSALTIIAAAIDGFPEISREHGVMAADHLLLVTARVLKTTFRGSDMICRYGPQEFLTILPDTSPTEAQYAVTRLERAISAWNDSTDFAYKLKLQIGVACHECGEPQQTVQNAVRNSRKHPGFHIHTSKPS